MVDICRCDVYTEHVVDVSESSGITTPVAASRGDRQRRRRVNCVMSPWSNWTPCPTSCDADVTWTTRQRHVVEQPEHGGRSCPRRLRRRRRCSPAARCGQCISP